MKNENCHLQFLGIKSTDTALVLLLHQFKGAKYRPGGLSRAFLKYLQRFPYEKMSPSSAGCNRDFWRRCYACPLRHYELWDEDPQHIRGGGSFFVVFLCTTCLFTQLIRGLHPRCAGCLDLSKSGTNRRPNNFRSLTPTPCCWQPAKRCPCRVERPGWCQAREADGAPQHPRGKHSPVFRRGWALLPSRVTASVGDS